MLKKIFLPATLITGAMTFSAPSGANILRVNNNPGTSAPYSTASAAIAAAATGDTLHFESSATSYSDAFLNKRLVVIGPGYFLNENPMTQANPLPANIVNLRCDPGSRGSVIQGITISNSFQIRDSFVTVQRNYINNSVVSFGFDPANQPYGDTIRNNYFNQFSSIQHNGSGMVKGLFIYNNLFLSTGSLLYTTNLPKLEAFFINNTCVDQANYNCSNVTFLNNIIYRATFINNTQSTNIFLNNIYNSGLPGGNGNQQVAVFDNVLLGWSSANGSSSDGRYRLKAGSPALGAGQLGGAAVDCGAFGGPAPYVLSGMPPVPSIYSLTVPASVPAGTTSLPVSISATTVHN